MTTTAVEVAPSARTLLNTGPSDRGAHRIELALKCQALYAFSRILAHEEATSGKDALVRGTIGHVALAHHYAQMGAKQHGVDPDKFYSPHEAVDIVAAQYGSQGLRYAALIHDVYRAYDAFYMSERQEIIAVEVPVEFNVPDPTDTTKVHRFTQRWDLVTKDMGGKLWVYDHKFVAKLEQKTIDRYALSIQFVSMVWLAAKLLGPQFGGVKLNLIGVGGPHYGFQRPAIPPTPDAVRRFPEVLAHAERRIAEVEALEDPWNAPRVFSETVCMTPYGPCPAVELCRFGKGHITRDGRTF